MTPIPQEWVKRQVDGLLTFAKALPPGAMRDACAVRAEYYMDLVEAWRKSDENPTKL